MSALLEVAGLEVRYGGIKAVKGISLSVAEGEMVCLIGANGAGKTTTLKAIAGLLVPAAGRIAFRGAPITGVARDGVTVLLVEQNARLALQTCRRAYVLESGEITLSGPAGDLLDDPKVRAAYLGE